MGRLQVRTNFLLIFIKINGEFLAPKLAELYTRSLVDGALPDSMRYAHIVQSHKASKNLKLRSSYRPIALLNNDVNILTKLLTFRIQHLLPSIIDADQIGFMPLKDDGY